MKSLTLTKINENNFQIQVTQSDVVNNKVQKSVIFSENSSLQDLVSKMNQIGVDKSETLLALEQMEQNFDDMASFGFLGGFICTRSSENTMSH